MDYDIQRNIEGNSRTSGGGEPVKLSIEHILGALFLWMFGNIVAVIIFVLEVLDTFIFNNEGQSLTPMRSIATGTTVLQFLRYFLFKY